MEYLIVVLCWANKQQLCCKDLEAGVEKSFLPTLSFQASPKYCQLKPSCLKYSWEFFLLFCHLQEIRSSINNLDTERWNTPSWTKQRRSKSYYYFLKPSSNCKLYISPAEQIKTLHFQYSFYAFICKNTKEVISAKETTFSLWGKNWIFIYRLRK